MSNEIVEIITSENFVEVVKTEDNIVEIVTAENVVDIVLGNPGPKGEQGVQGIQGPAGADGPSGADGAQGPKGDKGDTGEQGIQGVPGLAGADGQDGLTTSVNGIEQVDGEITLVPSDIGAEVAGAAAQALTDANVYSDTVAAIAESNANTYTSTNFVPNTALGNTVATLSGGKVPNSQLPPLAITDTYVVNSQSAMLALTAQTGDVAVRSDINKSYILQAEPSSTLTNWQELLTPPNAVLSVDGRTGSVSLTDLYDALGAAATAETNANSHADYVAGLAESNSNTYADGVAATAQSNAITISEAYTDNAIADEVTRANAAYDAIGAAATALTSANAYTDDAVSFAAGGTVGQILAKNSSTDFDTSWIDNTTSVVKHLVKLAENISKGQAVYVSGANGTNMLVSKASNATEATSSKTMGILETGGVTNDQVNVITEGLLAGLNTSSATIGDPVWLGTDGNLIYGLASKPSAPAHLVFIGIVTRVHATQGEIFVKVQNGFELREIHDVALTSPADGEVLTYESSTGLWKNKYDPEYRGLWSSTYAYKIGDEITYNDGLNYTAIANNTGVAPTNSLGTSWTLDFAENFTNNTLWLQNSVAVVDSTNNSIVAINNVANDSANIIRQTGFNNATTNKIEMTFDMVAWASGSGVALAAYLLSSPSSISPTIWTYFGDTITGFIKAPGTYLSGTGVNIMPRGTGANSVGKVKVVFERQSAGSTNARNIVYFNNTLLYSTAYQTAVWPTTGTTYPAFTFSTGVNTGYISVANPSVVAS